MNLKDEYLKLIVTRTTMIPMFMYCVTNTNLVMTIMILLRVWYPIFKTKKILAVLSRLLRMTTKTDIPLFDSVEIYLSY